MKNLLIFTMCVLSPMLANSAEKECSNEDVTVKDSLVSQNDGANDYYVDSQQIISMVSTEQTDCAYSASGVPNFFETTITIEEVNYTIAGQPVTETVLCTEKKLIIGTDCQ